MGAVTAIAAKVEAGISGLGKWDVLRKTVTIPAKALVIGAVAVLALALALSLAHKAQPQVNSLLWSVPADPIEAKIDALRVDLKETTAACLASQAKKK